MACQREKRDNGAQWKSLKVKEVKQHAKGFFGRSAIHVLLSTFSCYLTALAVEYSFDGISHVHW